MATMCGIVKETAGPGLNYRTDLPIPVIHDDEVLIKVRATALCGSDIHMYEWDEWSSRRMKPPIIIGHETAGDIVEVGKNVTNVKVGDRVAVETHVPCNECYFCKNGLKEICKNVELFGVTIPGAFAEYAKIRSDCVYKLNPDITYEMGCMFEPMGAGVHGVEAAEVDGKTVLVSGCGPIGLTAITASKVFGATTVIACDLFDQKLEIAKDMGADFVLNSGTCNLVEEVKKLTDGLGADAAIDITGVGSAIVSSLQAVRGGGRMVCVGLPSKEVTMNLTEDLIFRQVVMTGVSGRRIWDTWDHYAKVMSDPRYQIKRIMGREFALKDFKEAIQAVRDGVPGKMILHP
jgi:threonine 3-dehydrogenase